jgi:hypothetical protein
MFIESPPLYWISYDENHRCVKWLKGDICFSYTKKGNGLACHFSTKKGSAKKIREAFDDFISWAFYHYEWCEMLFAYSNKGSINRLLRRLNWSEYDIVYDDIKLFIKVK